MLLAGEISGNGLRENRKKNEDKLKLNRSSTAEAAFGLRGTVNLGPYS